MQLYPRLAFGVGEQIFGIGEPGRVGFGGIGLNSFGTFKGAAELETHLHAGGFFDIGGDGLQVAQITGGEYAEGVCDHRQRRGCSELRRLTTATGGECE